MIVSNTEILGVAAEIVFIFLKGSFFRSFYIGEGLPLAIDLNGNRVFVQHFLKGFFRLCHRGRRFRLLDMQPFHYHIIRQVVFLAGINCFCFGLKNRTRLGRLQVFLFRHWLYRLMGQSILSQLIYRPQSGGNICPALFHCSAEFIMDIDFKPCGRSKIVSRITGLKFHGLCCTGIGLCQLFCNFGIALTRAEISGNRFTVRLLQQAAVPG